MAGPLLQTKLYAPQPRRGLVSRPRLLEKLERATEAKLTLASAPAGFGKTTLLAEWRAALPDRVNAAWLSLDANDNAAAAFWAHVIAALGTVAPGVGAEPPIPEQPIDQALTALLNDLAQVEADTFLIIDDFHTIDDPNVHEGMSFLLEHLPPYVHVVIATRVDPRLPLARMRARGDLVEVRAADLRFSPAEAAAYFAEAIGIDLDDAHVATLAERTEGWIAALQLAGLSMQGREDVSGFIDGFAGDDRYVIDYLVEEVLQRQPADVRQFLLATSILARMCGPLCDAVTGQGAGKASLEALERDNLFLVPLDDRREWYRYHHLFADVLRARLADEHRDGVADLHRRAAEWYEHAGHRSDAIAHAMAGKDFIHAAELVELAMPSMHQTRQEGRLRAWLDALPSDIFDNRPVLTAGYVGALMSTGHTDGVEDLLDRAEGMLRARRHGAESGQLVIVDQAEFARLPGSIAMYRTALALLTGDVAATIQNAEHALEVSDPSDHLRRGGAASLIGLAHWRNGDLDEAFDRYAGGMQTLQQGGYLADAVGGAVTLADIRLAQGCLTDAMALYEGGLELATGAGGAPLRGAADMHVGMSSVLRERNELDAANHHLAAARELGEENGLPKYPWRSREAAAQLRWLEGDVEGAMSLLADAERLYTGDFSPNVRPVAAVRARMWIAQGNLSDARAWARREGLAASDDPDYVSEFDHATLARLLLADGRRDADPASIAASVALGLRLLHAAEQGGRWGSVIDIGVALALAHHASGDIEQALDVITRVATLAAPEGHLRVFLDEAAPIRGLLGLAVRRDPSAVSLRRLQSAFDDGGGQASRPDGAVDALSERELDVLRLLASELDGPEIARELVVSLNTVRTHTKNIYGKLGVNSRRAAVRRADELRLLSARDDRRLVG